MRLSFILPHLFAFTTLFLSLAAMAAAQEENSPQESDYYQLVPLPIPEGVVLEAGGLEITPQGKLAVSSRRGDIYMVENPLAADLSKVKFSLFASGLHEVLGLSYRDGWLYATQRGEVSRLKDESGDGRADLFETFADGWDISGYYH